MIENEEYRLVVPVRLLAALTPLADLNGIQISAVGNEVILAVFGPWGRIKLSQQSPYEANKETFVVGASDAKLIAQVGKEAKAVILVCVDGALTTIKGLGDETERVWSETRKYEARGCGVDAKVKGSTAVEFKAAKPWPEGAMVFQVDPLLDCTSDPAPMFPDTLAQVLGVLNKVDADEAPILNVQMTKRGACVSDTLGDGLDVHAEVLGAFQDEPDLFSEH